jgi:hypothetical protein
MPLLQSPQGIRRFRSAFCVHGTPGSSGIFETGYRLAPRGAWAGRFAR